MNNQGADEFDTTSHGQQNKPESQLPESIFEQKVWWHDHNIQAWLLLPAVMLMALVMIQSPSTWMTLTIAGLAMGMMIFIMTSGFTLVFGLMNVLNFGHGAFISLGAFCGFTVMKMMPDIMASPNVWLNLSLVLVAIVVAMIAVGIVAYGFEQVLIKKVYGDHLMQILITMGGLIVVEQLIYVLWGPEEIPLLKPLSFQGGWTVGDFSFEKFRLLAVGIGLMLFFSLRMTFKRTKIGLLIRAGVENREMVESFGYNVKQLFILVFVAGAALAALGGVLWGLYEENITAHFGQSVMIIVFIVAITGGLGSVEGCFVAAVLVGLLSNYIGFLAPKLSLISNILLMVVVLLWRPEGLLPIQSKES